MDVLCSTPPIANPTPVTENNDSGTYAMAVKLGATVGIGVGDEVGAGVGSGVVYTTAPFSLI